MFSLKIDIKIVLIFCFLLDNKTYQFDSIKISDRSMLFNHSFLNIFFQIYAAIFVASSLLLITLLIDMKKKELPIFINAHIAKELLMMLY